MNITVLRHISGFCVVTRGLWAATDRRLRSSLGGVWNRCWLTGVLLRRRSSPCWWGALMQRLWTPAFVSILKRPERRCSRPPVPPPCLLFSVFQGAFWSSKSSSLLAVLSLSLPPHSAFCLIIVIQVLAADMSEGSNFRHFDLLNS